MKQPIPLISEQDSWISVDPIVGCPAHCAYCYLVDSGLTRRKPTPRISPAQLVGELTGYCDQASPTVPVCIGNYTDMLLTPSNVSYLTEFVKEFSMQLPKRALCVVTKAIIPPKTAATLAGASERIQLLFFLSQSFATSRHPVIEKGNTATFQDTLRNICLLRENTPFKIVHFWRPFISSLNPADQMEARMSSLQSAGSHASVVVGLKHRIEKTGVRRDIAELLRDESDRTTPSGDETIDEEALSVLLRAASVKSYPIYRNTSCAVAFALTRAEVLGTRFGSLRAVRCYSACCPDEQRAICDEGQGSPLETRQVEAVERICREEKLGLIAINEKEIVINGLVDEFTYNRIVHVSRREVTCDGVSGRRAWLGSLTGKQGAHGAE